MTAREDQHTIARWQAETFGPSASDFSIAARALEEVAELARLVATCAAFGGVGADDDRHDRYASELADVWIVLCRLAESRRVNVNSFRSTVSQMLSSKASTDEAVAAIAHRLGRVMLLLASPVHRERQIESALLRVFRSIYEAGRSVDRSFKIWDHVDRKMEINRARQWERRGDGHGQHVREFQGEWVPAVHDAIDEDAGL